MPQTSDITIIGSGIIGLLTAKELSEVGYNITLIDKSFSGQESSWAGGGILLPLYPWRQPQAISTLVLESIKKYQALSKQLLSTTGIDPEWYDCGLLICKNPDIEEATQWCHTHNIPFEEASDNFFSALDTQTSHPLWMPSIAQARNPRLLKSLKAYLLDVGVNFIENCEITGCSLKNDKIDALMTQQQKIDVNQLIICTGAWTGKLAEQLTSTSLYQPNISPVKGQMILFDAKPDTLPHMILDEGHYLIPRKDGKILAGSSVEYTEFNKSTSTRVKDDLYTFATDLFPALKAFPVSHHWAGLRPGTEQGVPYICKHPEISNLAINAGHFRNGLVMGPASAQLMADLILDRPPCVDPKPYSL